MEDELRLLERYNNQSSPQGIALQTRQRRDIPNELVPPPAHPQQTEAMYRSRFPTWRFRRPVDWARNYNCAGHIWAARRVHVRCEHWALIQNILDDDGYRQIKADEVHVGDLVLYKALEVDREPAFLHVGCIVEMIDGAGISSRRMMALSKWGTPVGEVIHDVWHHPFDDPVLEYWTDRSGGTDGARQQTNPRAATIITSW